MNTNPRRPLDNENGYEQRPGQYPHPSVLQPARQAPARQASRPTIRQPQPQMGFDGQQSRPDQYSQRERPAEQYAVQQQPVLQRQRSRPDQPYPGQPGQRPQQQPYPDTTLQLQPSRPDLPPTLQRQPSRPDQFYSEPAPLQPIPMADPTSYQYKALPVQPVGPALMRAPSAPTSQFSRTESETTLVPPIRPYADTMLIRGNSDDELDKTDIFWRRFNASAVQQQLPDAEQSSWLEKNEGKSSRHTRTLWIVGFIFVLLAAAGIGIGVYLSFRNPSNTSRPDTLGGAEDFTSAGQIAATAAGGAPVAGGGGGGGSDGAPTSSSLHVTPTNTVA